MLLRIPDNWMTQLLSDHDVHIRVFGCVPYESRGGRGLMRISSDENLDILLDDVRRRREVLRASFSRVSERAVVGEVVIDRCAACMALKQSDCFMVSSRSSIRGWLEWTVAAESNGTISDLVDLLKRYGCEAQLTRISSSSGGCGLTPRQEEILQFAYSNGYFEYPRRIRLRDLSLIFDVSSSTMSEILRAGQRRVFSEYFGIPQG
ncbi:MAG: helix-turn-helix domain-containing protein [Candidatus Methanoperedens sp.]|nr:helix-turn-helix domain-containing protein [Candidatus Methanoperedens sp.]